MMVKWENKVVGELEEVGDSIIFYKKVKPSHFFRIANGYGIQKEVFDKYLAGQNGFVKIDNGEKILVASIITWEKHGKEADYGYGKQRFLSLRFMENNGQLL